MLNTTLESVVVFVHSCIAIISISLNFLMVYLVFRHTPKSFSTFGIMLKFHALADLITSLGSSLAMQRIALIGWSVFYISYGPCGVFGTTACFYSFAMLIGGVGLSYLSIAASFVFRLMVIEGKTPSRRQAFGLLAAFPIPLFLAATIPFLLSRDDDKEISDWLNKFRPEYEPFSHVLTGYKDIRKGVMWVNVLIALVTSWIFYATILILRQDQRSESDLRIFHCRSRILASLARQSRTLSDKSRKLHRKFVSMLSAQSLLPLLLSFCAGSLLLEFFDIAHSPALESSSLMIAELTAVFSPLIVLFFIDHYRRAAWRMLSGRPRENMKKMSQMSSYEPAQVAGRF